MEFMTPDDLKYLPQKPFVPKPIKMDYPIPLPKNIPKK
jgi:hypothetical protein